jgi:hypothetical protein
VSSAVNAANAATTGAEPSLVKVFWLGTLMGRLRLTPERAATAVQDGLAEWRGSGGRRYLALTKAGHEQYAAVAQMPTKAQAFPLNSSQATRPSRAGKDSRFGYAPGQMIGTRDSNREFNP